MYKLSVLLHINSQLQGGVSMITKAMFKCVNWDPWGLLMGMSVNSCAYVAVHSDIISLHSRNI
jgi:hypothetical protein